MGENSNVRVFVQVRTREAHGCLSLLARFFPGIQLTGIPQRIVCLVSESFRLLPSLVITRGGSKVYSLIPDDRRPRCCYTPAKLKSFLRVLIRILHYFQLRWPLLLRCLAVRFAHQPLVIDPCLAVRFAYQPRVIDPCDLHQYFGLLHRFLGVGHFPAP